MTTMASAPRAVQDPAASPIPVTRPASGSAFTDRPHAKQRYVCVTRDAQGCRPATGDRTKTSANEKKTRLVAGPCRSSACGAGGYLASNSQRLMLRGGSASVLGNSLTGVSTISSTGFFPGSLSASRFGAAIRHILPAP